MEGVVYEDEVAKEAPPVIAEYQSIVLPAEDVALNVTVPVPQRLAGVDPVIVGLMIVIVPVAGAEPETEPVDTVMLVEGTEEIAIVCAVTAPEPTVGTIKK
jgi:hypothetical protein